MCTLMQMKYQTASAMVLSFFYLALNFKKKIKIIKKRKIVTVIFEILLT